MVLSPIQPQAASPQGLQAAPLQHQTVLQKTIKVFVWQSAHGTCRGWCTHTDTSSRSPNANFLQHGLWAPPPSLIPACLAARQPITPFVSRLNLWKAASAGNQSRVLVLKEVCQQQKVLDCPPGAGPTRAKWCHVPKTGFLSRIRLARSCSHLPSASYHLLHPCESPDCLLGKLHWLHWLQLKDSLL